MSITVSRWWWVAVVLLLPAPQVDCRNVTHEDIRDAMLSLVHMFRTSEDKLERHEYREKALGDQLKKILAGLEKRHRALEPLKGMISRLDERLSNVETILLQKEEREKTSQKKTNEALEGIQQSLRALASSPSAAKIDSIQLELENLKNRGCMDAGSDVNPLEKHISEAEKLLNKYELKLNEYNTNGSRVQTDFVPLSEVSMADEAWHSKMSEVMERQEGEIRKIRHLLSDAEGLWKELPRQSDVSAANNDTLRVLQDTSETIRDNVEQSVNKVTLKLRELGDRLTATNEDVQRSLTVGNSVSERSFADIGRNIDNLKNEVSAMAKSEGVLLRTADEVLATRRRLEYGERSLLQAVAALVADHAHTLNSTLHRKLDNLSEVVVGSQAAALSNVSATIQAEVSAVWRQVGVMYTQLSASKAALDKLTGQTEAYVNGSSATMDSMKDKVGTITTRMTEINDNLNYLLGRLSLVTQEFNQVKAGLSDALDQVKANFHSVQDKLKDAGPGPHNITEPVETPAADTSDHS